MANKDVLKISFDAEAGIKELERDLLGSMDQISDEVADKLEKAFEKAGRNPKLKKQLTGVYQGLFDELTGASGNLDKVNAAIDRFAGKIEYINTVTRKSKVPGIFDNLSIKDVDKVLKGYDSVIEKEEELAKLSSNEYKNDIRTKTTVNSLKALENAYKTTGEEKTKYEKKVTDYIKNSGVETSAISKEIKQYSSLITLFEKINNTKVDYGSEDAIKKSQALLFVMQKIVDLEGGNKLFSNFRTNELKDIEKITSSIFELTQNGVEGSITSFVSKMMKPIKDEITSLYEGVVKDLLKMSKHQAIADAKTQAKVSNAINSSSGNKSKKTGNGVDTGDSDNSPDFVEKPDGIDVWKKSAQELKEEFKDVIKYATDAETALAEFNRLGKEIENKQHERGSQGWKDFMGYGQKLLSLDREALDDNDYSDFFWNKETEYEQFLDRVDQMTQKQLEKIEKLKSLQKDTVTDEKIGGSGDIDDSKVEELKKEITEVKEDISSLKGRVDTLEDTTAFDNLSSQVAGFDEKIKSVDGSIENLVNSFKLLSELSLTDLQKVSIPFFNGINQVYKENNGNKISGYWDKLKEEIEGSNVELRELLKLVGLYNSEKDNVKLVSSGMVKSGGLVGDTHTLLATKNKNNRFEETQLLKQKLDEAYTAGVNVSRILDIIGTKESDVFLEIQETASGNILGDTYNENPWVNPDIYKATDEQIKKLMSDLVTLNKLGIGVDTNLTNIFYDKEKGFSFIDLDLKPVNFKDYDEMFSEFINTTVGEAEAHYEDIDDKGNLEIAQKLRERFEKLSEQVQQAYAEAQDSHSPSKEFEKLENDAVDGIVAGANKNEEKLKNVGKQMADNVKDGFKEGMSEIDTTTVLSDINQGSSLSSPTQEFDNEMQQNLVYLENYKNTLKEIDALKLQPETDETKRKIEELNKLADYFVSRITVIRNENNDHISPEMMWEGYNWSGRLQKYPDDKRKELYQIARDKQGLLKNSYSEFSGISEEISRIESQSEGLRQSLTKTMQESTKFASSIKHHFLTLIDCQKELKEPYNSENDIKAYNKEIDKALEKFPQLIQFKDKFVSYESAVQFTKTDEWNDFLATLPQAKAYLESIDYEFREIEQIQSGKIDILSDIKVTDTSTNIGTTGMVYEAEQADILRQKIVEVATAVDTKTRAFQEEEQVVVGTVQREISSLEMLEGQITSIINEIKRLDDIKIQINLDGSQIDDSFVTLLDDIKTKADNLPVDVLSNLAKALKELKVTSKTAENLDLVAIALSEFKDSLNGISSEGNEFLKLIGDITSRSSELKDLADILKSTTKKIKEASEATKKVEDKSEDTDKDTSAGKKNKNYDAKKNQAAIEETKASMEKLKHLSDSDIFSNAFAEASAKIEEANTELKIGNDSLTEYRKKVKEIQAELQKKAGVVKFVDPGDLENARTVIGAYAREISEYQAKIKSDSPTDKGRKQNITYEWIEKETGMVRTLTLTYDKLTGAIYESSKAHKQAEKSGFKFSEMLKQGWMNVVRYVSSFVGFYEVINWIRNGVTVIRELDTALTEMRKVSDESVQSLKNFQKISFDIGNSIGATAAQIQNSAADFMRLGYSLQEASELAEDANIYANVGDMEIDEATEHMISSIKAWESEFESEVEASEAIIDRYNEIGNNFAISSADIGSAMERSSAALKAGGNTLNESLGLITAGNIIQQDAETTAAALKILSLRIRGSKAELEEMGESTDGLASSTSKLREEIKGLTGIDIMADENTYKSTAQIIQEIGEVWENLTDVSQAATLEKLAGELNCLKFVETHFYRTHLIARIA